MLLEQGKRILVFYESQGIEIFVGCISAITKPIEIEVRKFGRCSFYTFDNGNTFIQLIGTHCQVENIRGDK